MIGVAESVDIKSMTHVIDLQTYVTAGMSIVITPMTILPSSMTTVAAAMTIVTTPATIGITTNTIDKAAMFPGFWSCRGSCQLPLRPAVV